jgi:hypothetical protein
MPAPGVAPEPAQSIVFGVQGNASEAVVFGWSPPEDGYTWTIGKRSVLCSALPHAPHGFALDITWSAYVHAEHLPSQRVTISAGGRTVAHHRVEGLETVSFTCPPPHRHEQRLLLEFDLPDAAQPSRIAGHHDDRVLALCFRWIKILINTEPPLPPTVTPTLSVAAEGVDQVAHYRRGWPDARPGQPPAGAGTERDILFGAQGNASAFTRDGWSAPEPGYLWTEGARSRLVLPALDPALAEASAWELEAELSPFVHGDALTSQRLGLSINGVPAGTVRLADLAIVRLELPREQFAGTGEMELVFLQPDAASPAEFAGGNDTRALGFSFKRLLLTPAQAIEVPPDARTGPGTQDGPLPLDRLMLGFESLGENCEFGLVQRRCGAEPLGLLRFASAPLPKLLAALNARFEGLGASGNIEVELSSNGREYMIRDRAYDFYYHAWVLAGAKTPGEIHDREVRRVPFLVNKLIDDLSAGEKIFVYHGMKPLTLAHARALTRAIRRYGAATLLWVELADASHPNGTVLWRDAGLMQGFIDRFAPGDDAHDFATDSWVQLCRQAVALRTASGR